MRYPRRVRSRSCCAAHFASWRVAAMSARREVVSPAPTRWGRRRRGPGPDEPDGRGAPSTGRTPRRPGGARGRGAATAQVPRGVRGTGRAHRAPADRHRGGPRASTRRWTTCCSWGRPGSGKTSLAGIVAAEMGVGLRITSGPALVRTGDLAALLTDLQLGRRPLHRRGPPAAACGRRGPLPGDGGLPARHPGRQGPHRALHPARPAPLHPRGRDDADRIVDEPAPGPFRLRGAPRPVRRRRAAGDRLSFCGDTRRPDGRRRGPADRRTRRGVRPESPTDCCGVSATSSRCAPTVSSPRSSPQRVSISSGSTSSGSTRSTGRSSTHCAVVSGAARWGSPPSPSAWGRRPTRSRTPTSPSCSSRASSSGPRRVGSPRPGRSVTSGGEGSCPGQAAGQRAAGSRRPRCGERRGSGLPGRGGWPGVRSRLVSCPGAPGRSTHHASSPPCSPSCPIVGSSKAATNTSNLAGLALSLIVIFELVYVLFLRPRAQQARRQRDTLMELSAGDEVLTGAGIFGTVQDIEADRVTLWTAPGTDHSAALTIARRLTDRSSTHRTGTSTTKTRPTVPTTSPSTTGPTTTSTT